MRIQLPIQIFKPTSTLTGESSRLKHVNICSGQAFLEPCEFNSITNFYKTYKYSSVSFKAEEVALVIDWEDSSSGSSTSEEDSDESFRLIKPISNLKESTNFSSTRTSMKGLQAAIAEGWLVQRARDMCSFSHDRYRQAAVAEAEKLSDEMIAKMSFRVRRLWSN